MAIVRGLVSARGAGRVLPIGGLLIAAATFGAVLLADGIPGLALLGLVLIGGLTALARRAPTPSWVVALASIPGAFVMSLGAPADPSWVRAVVLVSVPVAGYLIGDFETRYSGLGLGVLFFGVAAAGTFLAVPDTELVRTLFAVCLPISFLAWPKVVVSLGTSGSYLAAAVFAFFTSIEGVERPASVIGAIACLGFLVVEPVMVRLRPRLTGLADLINPTAEAAIWASVPQLILVYLCSRVAAHFASRVNATMVAGLAFISACLLLLWIDNTRMSRMIPDHSDV